MICADTSVWVTAFRDARSPEARHLRELIDLDQVLMAAPVRVELLSGAPAREQRRLRGLLAALPQAVPDGGTWNRIEEWIEVAAARQERFGMGDLLIAAASADHDSPLWTADHDFRRMENLGFVRIYRAPRTVSAE